MNILRNRRRLSGIELVDQHWFDLDLRGIVAQGTKFIGCSFTRCKLGQGAFADTLFDGCTFTSCELGQAVLVSWIKSSKFIDCMLDQASFTGGLFQDSLFKNCRLEYSNWDRATIQRVKFDTCALHGARLDLAESTDCEFDGCNLWGAVVPASCAFFRGTRLDKRSLHMLLALLTHTEGNEAERDALRSIVDERYLRAVGRLVNAEINGEGIPPSEDESGAVHGDMDDQDTTIGNRSHPSRILAG